MWRLFQQEMQRRTQRRDESDFAAERIGDIQWQWRQVCEISGLGRLIFTPSGQAVSIPRITQVVLGPPTRFTVRLQPGQLASDVAKVAPRIAAAMHAHDAVVTELAIGWVLVELVPAPAFPHRGDAPKVIPFTVPHRDRHGYADVAA
jgi:hypothetical protein